MQTKQQGLMKYLLNLLSDGAKDALVRPICKKEDRQNKENYSPVSVWNDFSKVYERFTNDSMLAIIKTLFELKKTIQCRPCSNKSNKEPEKEPRQ